MEKLKYKIIKTVEQYKTYCNLLETLVDQSDEEYEDEIELLTFLIEKWDEEYSTFQESDPVELLKILMEENRLKSKDLSELLGIGKSVVSEILSYKKGFSKEIIRKLSERFKLRQEAFNRPYQLSNKSGENKSFVEAAF
ncbi:MAG: transcriptional regulator [Sphingobacteriaceae bacterium]|nr:MAG: transcriptional regulator [Sphingobacteriaceae bacterium]